MPRRKANPAIARPTPDPAPPSASVASVQGQLITLGEGRVGLDGTRVLLVARESVSRNMWWARLAQRNCLVTAAEHPTEAMAVLESSAFELCLVFDESKTPGSGQGMDAVACVQRLTGMDQPPACIMVAEEPNVELALRAMRAGAADVLERGTPGPATLERLEDVLARTRRAAARLAREQRRVRRLTVMCRELNDSRKELLRQVGELCSQLSDSCRGVQDQLASVALSSELNAILRQELELEGLLRTLLEYALRKIGPTNAAVFLPGNLGEFTLGAYVNYDGPRDAAETLLDAMADALPGRFEESDGLTHVTAGEEIFRLLGNVPDWMSDAAMLVYACRRENECLGVVCLFRDRRTPFTAEHIEKTRLIGSLFAEQLARVVRMHHRHLPKDEAA